jgi:hypothetical protein
MKAGKNCCTHPDPSDSLANTNPEEGSLKLNGEESRRRRRQRSGKFFTLALQHSAIWIDGFE